MLDTMLIAPLPLVLHSNTNSLPRPAEFLCRRILPCLCLGGTLRGIHNFLPIQNQLVSDRRDLGIGQHGTLTSTTSARLGFAESPASTSTPRNADMPPLTQYDRAMALLRIHRSPHQPKWPQEITVFPSMVAERRQSGELHDSGYCLKLGQCS